MYTKTLPCSIGCEELWAQGRAVPCAATATRGVEAAAAQLQRRLDICSVTSVISRPVCSRAGSPRSWRRRHHLPARRRVVAAVRRLARPRAQGASQQGRQARAGVLDDLLLNECALDPLQLDVEELLDEELLDVEELQSDEELREAGVLSSTARPGVARISAWGPGDAEPFAFLYTHITLSSTRHRTSHSRGLWLTRPLTYQALELQLFDGRRTTDSPRQSDSPRPRTASL